MKERIIIVVMLMAFALSLNSGFAAPRKAAGGVFSKRRISPTELERARIERIENGGLHIISTDYNGDFLDHCEMKYAEKAACKFPKLKGQQLNRKALHMQLDDLFKELNPQIHKKIVIFIHGGLNTEKGAREGAFEKMAAMRACDEGKKIFPIFLTWNTEAFSSYGQNFIFESGGISYKHAKTKNLKILGAPFRFTSDLITGLAKVPENIASNMSSALQARKGIYKNDPRRFPLKRTYQWQLAGMDGVEKLGGGGVVFREDERGIEQELEYGVSGKTSRGTAISLGGGSTTVNGKQMVSTTVWLPLKAVTTFGQDWIATPAWHNMVRRTRTLVRPFEQFIHYKKVPKGTLSKDAFQPVEGVAKILTERVAGQKQYEIEFYGHSMGVMVFNEIIREINNGHITDPKFRRIVFLGAACSMRDFIDTTQRYIVERRKGSLDAGKGVYYEKVNGQMVKVKDALYRSSEQVPIEFFNLSLHPRTEVSEVMDLRFNPIASGSLLVWIDNYYQTPEAFLDRTLGTFANVVIAQDELLQGKGVTYKAFGYDGIKNDHIYGPQKHGELDDYRFWLDEYLQVQTERETDMNGGKGYAGLWVKIDKK